MPGPTGFSPTEIVRFVLARLDDEEAMIRRSARSLRGQDDPRTAELNHQRADCLSRRQVTGAVQQLLVLRDLPREKPVREHATRILLSLASPYAWHKAYRAEWDARVSAS